MFDVCTCFFPPCSCLCVLPCLCLRPFSVTHSHSRSVRVNMGYKHAVKKKKKNSINYKRMKKKRFGTESSGCPFQNSFFSFSNQYEINESL
uniref:Uncharacterized protein n=1 Tax=Anguilla anguilla TaxID=7936 RepID=A0A0E9WV00_ANGAN